MKKNPEDLTLGELLTLVRKKELEQFKKRFTKPVFVDLVMYATTDLEVNQRANIEISPDGTWRYT